MAETASQLTQRLFGGDLGARADDGCKDAHHFIKVEAEIGGARPRMWIVCATCGAREEMERWGAGFRAHVLPGVTFVRPEER